MNVFSHPKTKNMNPSTSVDSGTGRSRLIENFRRHRHHARDITQAGGNDESIGRLSNIAELLDVVLSDAKSHGILPARRVDRFRNAPQTFGRGTRDGQNRLCFALCLVYLLLLGRLRLLDHTLLLTFRLVDFGVALALRLGALGMAEKFAFQQIFI